MTAHPLKPVGQMTAQKRMDLERFVEWLRDRARGADQSATARVIRREIGFDDRYLRELARLAPTIGVLVCSGNAGYFLPATVDEVTETIGRLRSQAFEMLSRASAVERIASAHFGQRLRRAPLPVHTLPLFGVPTRAVETERDLVEAAPCSPCTTPA